MSWGEVKKAINSDISVPLNELIGSKIEYDTPGTYTFSAASNTLVIMQACGGGGGGYGSPGDQGGGGGGGGQAVVAQMLSVSKGEAITVVIGAGGAGGTNAKGQDGGDTTITGSSSGLLLTLTGGKTPTAVTNSGLAGGAGGGAGGIHGASGSNGIIGIGGTTEAATIYSGGGGGGSLGNGGNGYTYGTTIIAGNGVKGGGGGGGAAQAGYYAAGNGGDGYVSLVTGLCTYFENITPQVSSITQVLANTTPIISGKGEVRLTNISESTISVDIYPNAGTIKTTVSLTAYANLVLPLNGSIKVYSSSASAYVYTIYY
jgi:hypothetical protein